MKAEQVVKALTLEEKISLLSETAPEIERLNIRRYHHGNEALHGVVRPGKFTVFPQAIGMGASFNPALIEEVAEAISDEARARHNANKGEMIGGDYDNLYNGLLTFWSPNLNTARDPRWGRTGETYGEDPYLIGECGTGFVKGLQGKNEECLKVVATPKHFVANNEEHNRFECNANIPRKQYFDYYLKPFKTVVQEGECESVMGAYNAVDGVPCHANKELLTDILRERWGFKGYVVTDCGAVSHLVDRHKYAATPQEAAAQAIKAGVDLECGSCGTIQQVFGGYLKQACEQGLVSEEEIDHAVTRVLHAREKLGILEYDENPAYHYLTEEVIGCEKHQELALRLAEESLVLLKNDTVDGKPMLPFADNADICVIGPQAAVCQFGDYSGKPVHEPISILEGLKEVFPNANISFVPFEKPEELSDFIPIDESCLFHYEGEERKSGLEGTYDTGREEGEIYNRVDSRIVFEWENMAPDPLIQRKYFKIQWNGVIVPKRTGSYDFQVLINPHECNCKAKYHLTVNGESVWEDTGALTLERGKEYKIELEYLNLGLQPSVVLNWKYTGDDTGMNFSKEVEAAQKSSIVLACLGLGTEYEAEGRDKTDLNLPNEQMELLKAVYAQNKNIVVTLYNGSSLTIPWIKENAKAVLECWYPGEQGGKAIARVLKGEANPSGRLPLTFYEDVDVLPAFDCYDIEEGFTYRYAKSSLYPFGYGLSYTAFEYADLELKEGRKGSVKVKNTGAMAGYEVVQIYTKYLGAENEPKKLSYTEKVWLEPGEEKTVNFFIKDTAIEAYTGENEPELVRAGSYKVIVAKDAETEIFTAEADWK